MHGELSFQLDAQQRGSTPLFITLCNKPNENSRNSVASMVEKFSQRR